MSFTQDFFTSRTNLVDGTTKIGQMDRLWYEPQTNTIRIGNGTPGGLIVSGGSGSQVNADWDASTGVASILNKPTNVSSFINDADYVSVGYNPFDQSLNTTDDVTFKSVYTPSLISYDHLDLTIQAHLDKSGTIRTYANQFDVYTTTNPVPSFQIDQYGQIKMFTPTFDAATGSLSIIGSSDGAYVSPTSMGAMLHITGQPSTVSRMYNDASNNYALYVARRYNGSSAAPTVVLNGDIISRIAANGYNGSPTNAGFPLLGPARMEFVATEDFTTTGVGGKIAFYTTPNGSITPIRKLSISELGITFSDNTSQDTAAIPMTYLGNANGVATLGSDGKVPTSQLNLTGAVVYKGTWDANINSPFLHNGTGTAGWEYKVTNSGTVNFGAGDITFGAGDWVIYNGSIWEKIPGSSGVTAFNSRTGDVSLTSLDVTDALGFTPYSNTNPNNYITLSQIPTNVLAFNSRTGSVTLLSSDVISALATGSIQNSKLANSSITVNAGTGLSGGGTVALGGSITLTNSIPAYSLPPATVSSLGGIKVGSGLDVSVDGTLSTSSTPSSNTNAAFYDLTTQHIVNNANAYPVAIGGTYNSSPYITVTSGSYITVAHAGYYHFEYSIQIANPDNSQYDVTVWFRLNDTDINNSGSVFTLPPRINANTSAKLIANCPFDIALAAGDKIQIMWWTSVSTININSVIASSGPSRPVSPGVILNVRRIF